MTLGIVPAFLVIKMADFRKLVAISLFAGIVAGLLLSLFQHYQTQPLILSAEQFETPVAHHSHDWHPENNWQRNAFTALFNCLIGFGFALLLNTAMYWQEAKGFSHGLLWGMAGYLVFFAAPTLGLPPELPGTDSAALYSRQVWWLFTAAVTALGLFSLCFGKHRWLQIAGVILLLIPHLIGAPQPEVVHALAPDDLQQRFVQMSAISNALFWLVLGALSGSLLPKVKF